MFGISPPTTAHDWIDGEVEVKLQRNDTFAVSKVLGKYGSPEETPSRSSEKRVRRINDR
jgi:hypothetical protein